METHPLLAHPESPPVSVNSIGILLGSVPDGRLMLRWKVSGDSDLMVPSFSGRGRADELWKTTCFELFLMRKDGSYREFNFSPSGRWAAYEFDSRRSGMKEYEPIQWPEIDCQEGSGLTVMTVFLAGAELAGMERAGISAVIEEEGEVLSYWALAHRDKGGPDFHDPACFALELRPAAKK